MASSDPGISTSTEISSTATSVSVTLTSTTTSASTTDTSSSTSTTETTSSTSTTSLTTSSTETSTTSSTTSTLPPSTSSTPTLSSTTPITSASVQVSTSGGVVVTLTSIVVTTPTPTISTSASASSTGAARAKSFTENTGAVVGVSVVGGLIGLGLFFAAITFVIRRRRAKKFDRDVDEAAREAAGAHAPEFDDDVYGHGSDATGAGYLAGVPTGYSDNSHGTFNQQPMDANSGENYNMREMHNAGYDNYAGAGVNQARSAASHPDSNMTSGFAGFGALGGSNAYSAYGASEHSSQPYPAFAHQYNPAQYNNPNVGDYHANEYPNNNDYGKNDYVVNQDHDGGYAAAAATAAPVPQQDHNLNRQKSNARSLLDGNFSPAASVAEPVPAESYASRYARTSPSNAATSTAVHSDTHAANRPLSSATSYGDDPYGGYDEPDSSLPNPHSASMQPPYKDKHVQDDDEDDGRRILKVANE